MDFLRWYKKFSVRIFGNFVNKYIESFEGLRPYLKGAGIGILLKAWICIALLTTMLSYILSAGAVVILGSIFHLDFLIFLYLLIFAPIMIASLVFLFFYIYPAQRANKIKNSIENNLPFALSYMSAVASSGVPPEFMFGLLTGFKEYGEISKQAGLIVRNIKNFGMSSVMAMRDVAERTPSPQFKQILAGISSTIEKGGNLGSYLGQMAERSLFEYRVKRENYLKTLSTYADIYTAILVSIPLMTMVFLVMMGTIGGDIMGFTIDEAIFFVTWIFIPVANILFLLFLHMTSPET